MLHSRNDSGSESVIREMGVCLRQNRNDAYFRRGLMPLRVERRDLAGASGS